MLSVSYRMKFFLFVFIAITVVHNCFKLIEFYKFVAIQKVEFLSYPQNVDLWRIINSTTPVKSPVAINNISFNYLLNNDKLCDPGSGAPIHLVLLIKTHPKHFSHRHAIRNTWGNTTSWFHWNIKRIFLLGKTKDDRLMDNIILESNIHHDIIQQDFADSYFNNTYKTLMGLNWATKFCSHAQFLFMLDDDFLVNPRRVKEYLTQDVIKTVPYFIAGHKQIQAPVIRSTWGYFAKNRVPYSELSWLIWPPFVSAGAILLKMRVAKALILASRYTKYFRMDDVYLGIILYKLGIDPVDVPDIHCNLYPVLNDKLIASHMYDPRLLKRSWQEMNTL